MSSPRVTIALCSYNQADYLRESIESALAQTFKDIEVLVIDNGSTDGSHAILCEYSRDPRVRLVLHDENIAVSKRMNQAVALARGEFIAWLYSDDFYLPDRIERQIKRFDELSPEYGVVYGMVRGLNQKSGATWMYRCLRRSGFILRDLLLNYTAGYVDMLTPLTRVSAFKKYPFHEDLFAEGEVIFWRLAMTYKFSFIEEPLAVMRDHGGNRGKAIRKNAEMTHLALDRIESHPDLPEDCRAPLRKMRIDYWRNLGWQAVRLNDSVEWAHQCYRNAVRLSKMQAVHPKTIAGMALSLAPTSLRHRINALGHRLRADPGNAILVSGYGGGSES
jgi:glycosyltransferase involved in cell wall biosynthesis